MGESKHKVFISYHHANDQFYKEELIKLNNDEIFIDASVDTGDIDDNLKDEVIREKIRDEYLRDSTVTILLVGTETKNRKHVDWEIYSSMFDGKVNKKSGVLVVMLPSTGCTVSTAAHGDTEKNTVYPGSNWTSIKTEQGFIDRYPYMPARIIDNLLKDKAKVSVTLWDKIKNKQHLKLLIDLTYNDRQSCEYDLTRQMRRSNS